MKHASKTGATRALIAVASASLLVGAVFVQTAGAGLQEIDAPLTIVKVVDGVAPAGTTFTATVECDDEIIETGDGSTDQATVTFDASGQPTSADVIGFGDPGVCTVTETATGGAASTTYACEGTLPVETDEPDVEGDFSAAQVLPIEPVCETAGPQSAPITVNIIAQSQTATVTITNTFTAATPQPAAQVVAAPAFTG